MNNGNTHNLILDGYEQCSRLLGASTDKEVPVWLGGVCHYIDLTIRFKAWLQAVEAEMTPRRVEAALRKAAAISADSLLILTPNAQVRDGVCRKLRRLRVKARWPFLYTATIGQAVRRVDELFSWVAAQTQPG